MNQDVLKQLYKEYTGAEATEIIELPSSGSNRIYGAAKIGP